MSFIKDWGKDIAGDGHGWVQAQMRMAHGRCAYCGKSTDPGNWAGEDDDDWGQHLMCEKCWNELAD